MIRTIEIDDSLESRVRYAIAQLVDIIERYQESYPECPVTLEALDKHYSIHVTITQVIPISIAEVRGLWLLHWDLFEEAFDLSGINGRAIQNYGKTALYCYIQKQLEEWIEENYPQP